MKYHEKSPRSADEQDAPEPERLVTPEEEAGMDVAELDEPPQAEGPREDDDEAADAGTRTEDRPRKQ